MRGPRADLPGMRIQSIRADLPAAVEIDHHTERARDPTWRLRGDRVRVFLSETLEIGARRPDYAGEMLEER